MTLKLRNPHFLFTKPVTLQYLIILLLLLLLLLCYSLNKSIFPVCQLQNIERAVKRGQE